MRRLFFICLTALLSACSAPSFVGDAAPIPVSTKTPDHFEFPARFALARMVYGSLEPAGAEETALWTDLASRTKGFGSFSPLIVPNGGNHSDETHLIDIARQQRFTYLILARMNPSTGTADVVWYHTGSGGVMATAQASAQAGGQNGFWGGRIKNPARRERATFNIAKATVPIIEEMLRGAAKRQK